MVEAGAYYDAFMQIAIKSSRPSDLSQMEIACLVDIVIMARFFTLMQLLLPCVQDPSLSRFLSKRCSRRVNDFPHMDGVSPQEQAFHLLSQMYSEGVFDWDRFDEVAERLSLSDQLSVLCEVAHATGEPRIERIAKCFLAGPLNAYALSDVARMGLRFEALDFIQDEVFERMETYRQHPDVAALWIDEPALRSRLPVTFDDVVAADETSRIHRRLVFVVPRKLVASGRIGRALKLSRRAFYDLSLVGAYCESRGWLASREKYMRR